MARKSKKGGLGVGRTIAGRVEKAESDSERLAARKKVKSRKLFGAIVGVVIALGLVIFVLIQMHNFLMPVEVIEVTEMKYEPTVEIVDESSSGYVTERMREYVGRLERDLGDLRHKVVRAVVPSGKTREIDIYLEGRDEYYKCNMDRGTAVTAEDIEVMVRYLAEHDLHPGYVDVRTEGKAYYR